MMNRSKLIIKGVPLTVFLLLFLLSCAGAPEAADKMEPAEVAVAEKETVPAEPVYKTVVVNRFEVSRESYFLDDGAANGYKTFAYDAEGRQTLMENYRGSGDLIYREEFELDSQGRIIKSELYDADGLTSYTLFLYGEGDQPVEEEYYNRKDDYLSGSTYEYDAQGNRTLWVSLDGNRSPVLKSEYVYRDDKLVRVNFMTPLNKEDGYLEYEYQDDRLVKEVSVNSAGKEERKTEYVIEEGVVVQEKIFQLGRLSRMSELSYDADGNLILKTTYNRSAKLMGTTNYDYLVFPEEKQVLVD